MPSINCGKIVGNADNIDCKICGNAPTKASAICIKPSINCGIIEITASIIPGNDCAIAFTICVAPSTTIGKTVGKIVFT